jgi:hypothetical protein
MDTVIDSPCYNDDGNGNCGLKSKCTFGMTFATTTATIRAYGSASGTSRLTVTCSGGPTLPPPPPTLPPLPVDPRLHAGEKGSNVCADGSSRIRLDSVCQAAAAAVGIQYGEQEDSETRPIGCYVYEPTDNGARSVYYNGHVRGAVHPDATPLCAKSCDAETDCSSHGTTTDVNKMDGCSCVCDDGFTGDNCGTPPPPVPCENTACSGHGTTSDLDASDGCECTCTNDFRGSNCNIPPTCSSEHHCNGH